MDQPPSGPAGSAARKRVLIIFNPTAGSRRASRLTAVVRALIDMGATVRIRETAGPYDACQIASECTSADWDVVAAAGGDGTLNEVINGCCEGGPPVALIPLGTANLAAMEMGIGAKPHSVAEMILRGPARPAYFGRVNGRRFLLMTGIGFDAHVVRDVSSPLKRLIGKGAYVYETTRQMLRYGFPEYEVEIDGVVRRVASLIVMKGRYYAGPYICASAACFDEPTLYACLFEKPGRLQVVRYGINMLVARLETCSGYTVIPAKRIVIDAPDLDPVQVDGDLGGQLPIIIEASSEPIPLVRVPVPEGV